MSKSPRRLWPYFLAIFLVAVSGTGTKCFAADASTIATQSPLTDVSVIRAKNNLIRVESLVEQGDLPRKSVADAKAAVADAEDEQTLRNTLFGGIHTQNLSPDDAKQMVQAAARRVDRQQALVDNRTKLVDSGTLARGEMQPLVIELEMRKRSLDLARDRAKLVDQLVAMAIAEQALERAEGAKTAMIRSAGGTPFTLAVLLGIETSFEREFHEHLPVSALGQTFVHQELGFDHRGRVDVALNPDSRQGLWLRKYLESRHIPYIGFRSAVAGSATAPHIHIEPGSLRVKTPPPPDMVRVTGPLATRGS
jgi:hypothetical protein